MERKISYSKLMAELYSEREGVEFQLKRMWNEFKIHKSKITSLGMFVAYTPTLLEDLTCAAKMEQNLATLNGIILKAESGDFDE